MYHAAMPQVVNMFANSTWLLAFIDKTLTKWTVFMDQQMWTEFFVFFHAHLFLFNVFLVIF